MSVFTWLRTHAPEAVTVAILALAIVVIELRRAPIHFSPEAREWTMPQKAPYPRVMRDSSGDTLVIASRPQRIVSQTLGAEAIASPATTNRSESRCRSSAIVATRVEKETASAIRDASVLRASRHSQTTGRPTIARGTSPAGDKGAGIGSGPGLGSGTGSGSGSGAGDGFGSGGNGPQAIYAPAPTIPDDMRDQVLEAVAVVRFQVSSNGNVVVSLTQPTDFLRATT
jgi:hypothetical protein